MRIGNRLFPYPVINKNKNLSGFKENSNFEIKYDRQEIQSYNRVDYIVFKNIHFELNNNELLEMYKKGLIDCKFIVECSETMYRKSYKLTDEKQDVRIRQDDLNGKVECSSYLYAKESIFNYSNKDFTEIYDGYSFDLEKYSILGVDDGFKFTIDHNPTDDNKVSSIFLLCLAEDEENLMKYELKSNKIKIYLPRKYHTLYTGIKQAGEIFYNPTFSTIIMPVLTICLLELQEKYKESESIDEILEEFTWFKSICYSFKKETGKGLDIETFENNINAFELAQIVFNYATVKSIEALYEIANPGGDEEDDE